MSRVVHSYCRQCIAVCGLLVTVDGDDIVAVRGDPDHPVTNGYNCTKGRALGAMVASRAREAAAELFAGRRPGPA